MINNLPINIREHLGDRTYQIDNVGMSNANVMFYEDLVLKIEESTAEAQREHQMYQWLQGQLALPNIVKAMEQEEHHYLLMERLKGEYACSDFWLKQPESLVEMLVQALQMLWNIPIEHCPYDATLSQKLKHAEYNVEHGLCDMDDAEAGTYGENSFASPKALLEWLKQNQPEEDLVFSHGDFCLPNIFIDQGEISGFIDLGRSGIADRYQDIALCYRSLLHNFDGRYNGGMAYPNFDPNMLFEKLNITPDWEKIRYYILLDELF